MRRCTLSYYFKPIVYLHLFAKKINACTNNHLYYPKEIRVLATISPPSDTFHVCTINRELYSTSSPSRTSFAFLYTSDMANSHPGYPLRTLQYHTNPLEMQLKVLDNPEDRKVITNNTAWLQIRICERPRRYSYQIPRHPVSSFLAR